MTKTYYIHKLAGVLAMLVALAAFLALVIKA